MLNDEIKIKISIRKREKKTLVNRLTQVHGPGHKTGITSYKVKKLCSSIFNKSNVERCNWN